MSMLMGMIVIMGVERREVGGKTSRIIMVVMVIEGCRGRVLMV